MDTIDNSYMDDGMLSNSSTCVDLPWPLIPDRNGSRASSMESLTPCSKQSFESLKAVDEFEPISPLGRSRYIEGMAPFVPSAPQLKKPEGRPIASRFQTPKALGE